MNDTFDRDAAREVLRGHYGRFTDAREGMALGALEACVRPAPQQTIDRDALISYLRTHYFRVDKMDAPGHADGILALLRPVDGVILTREEASLAAEELRDAANGWTASDEHERADACDLLAQRLEASS